ncbi:DUF607-domain-containing protein [Mycena rebaudengoi]|nr:DUF607-domain-containing protein [Mycena rebaudengoi]
MFLPPRSWALAHLKRLHTPGLCRLNLKLCVVGPQHHYSKRVDVSNNANVAHSQFLADAGVSSNWNDKNSLEGGTGATVDEFDNLAEGKGKLSPTASHLFKLILPLGMLTFNQEKNSVAKGTAKKGTPPTVILLHPSQPLSHVSRLILASLAPATPNISFRSASAKGQQFQWSDSTDVGDFIKDAARSAKFSICISYEQSPSTNSEDELSETMIDVEVPTLADRTRFLRRRLEYVTGELKSMEDLKRACDREAHRGARRMATGGFALLAVYWGTVARLTFWDIGWEVMEPVTYLSGLSTVMAGYLWFLYQGREVSYTSVLDRSISARREALYVKRDFDIERWMDLVTEGKNLRREIRRISEDYDHHKHQREKDRKAEEELAQEEASFERKGEGKESEKKD